ncbi:MAG: GNAT family N-acetyltransferase [Phenylobacterium sp. RIFCSPHIGHO2_01_FULL_69_31]|uniref:GNAT family N-acetyltransferase n=1 Tax=Phenylobacterium sp. RIFCSPHIGHO2_01_FULL_69_31 TaxID=1801944 RepID=UPI0008D221FC|nr:GNAT family N-acetyltransferase [Phenylobacterium sp. RIFCSPHIGHO2_01_FULL_69_31]OHB27222.1 MAG: GNAT family N-acetyltransferase [Phenylobacterium sp. RIFCSPHIGHO2_01_FULL_69_31]
MDPADIESLERATVEAVAPPQVLEIGGWLVPLDDGTIGRAKSAVPLRHDLDASALDEIEAAYRGRGLKPAFRVADVPGLAAVVTELSRRGYVGEKPTLVMTAPAERVAQVAVPFADLLDHPDEAWGAVFLGEGFDPVDGAHRVRRLTDAPDALYGAIREGGRTVAVGVVSFGHGWAGVHGMRTAVDRRGSGFASRLLALFGAAAEARQVNRIFLQVEGGNPAQNLYKRAGFEEAWRYQYWR